MDGIFKITKRAISMTSSQKCQVIKEMDKLISVGFNLPHTVHRYQITAVCSESVK